MTATSAAAGQQRSACSTVYARDGGLPPNLSKATVRITVGDENDHAPLLESESYSVEVPENQSHVALYTLRAADPDAGENGRLEYHLAGEARSEPRGCLLRTGQGLFTQGSPRLHQWQLLLLLSSPLLQSTWSCCRLSAL